MNAPHRIDSLTAPLLVTWQLTRDCDLACLHCCTDSAPGKRLPDELSEVEALEVARQIAAAGVPYVMLAGGEPMVSPHFWAVAETLGQAGVTLKIETNGQKVDRAVAKRLARLPIRSVQVSLDGDTEATYARQRPGGTLSRAHAACEAIVAAGMPLEITFAPTRFNIHEAAAVIDRARRLGAFRFNTGQLMRIGTAARHWSKVEPDAAAYADVKAVLARASSRGDIEVLYEPFTLEEALRTSLGEPPATLLVLPNGWVKVAAALPHVCADLRQRNFGQAWDDYRRAWHGATMATAVRGALEDAGRHAQANSWQLLSVHA
jgi:MoaA/NifB/PqqE/SkfB family radical SAM enzyme